MRIVIAGTGAIGCLFGAILKKNGADVALLGKNAREVDAVNSHGVTVETGDASESITIPAFRGASAAGQADLVIVAVKSYDTAEAAGSVREVLAEGGAALTLQNGIGNAETIAAKLGRERVLCGTTAHGSHVIAPGRVRHAGEGETLFGEMDGSLSDRARDIARLLSSSGISSRAVANAPDYVWLKLMINAAVNPLTAIHNVRNGALLDIPGVPETMQAAAEEAEAVARARGVEIPCEDVMEKVRQVCAATADNISSMLQDIRAGKRTEVDYINGAVARLGKETGVPTPVNSALTARVKAIEKSQSRKR